VAKTWASLALCWPAAYRCREAAFTGAFTPPDAAGATNQGRLLRGSSRQNMPVGELKRDELDAGIHRPHGRHNRVVELDVLAGQDAIDIVLVEDPPPSDVLAAGRLEVLASPVEASGIVVAHQIGASTGRRRPGSRR